MHVSVKARGENMKKMKPIILLLIGWVAISALSAQTMDEDVLLLRDYILPDNAIPESTLISKDSLSYYRDLPFTGVAFEKYENHHLKQVTEYKNGMKHGFQYVWYPDAKPLLLSNYKRGHLNGRFKGWYQFGGVIYDMFLKDSSFGGDQRYDDDAGRTDESTEDTDNGQDGRDQAND
jgi:antitoxin component YwqK of YwqJK toxin-antitoxin module